MNLKSIIGIAFLLAVANSNPVVAGVFKCKDASGKVVYQPNPCKAEESSAEIVRSKKEKTSDKGQHSRSKSSGNGPEGQWVNSRNSNLRASISRSGAFEMTDYQGDRLTGRWKANGSNSYTIDASWEGISFPVNMRYNAGSDSLQLSKPGLPGSYNTYQRQ